MSHPVLQAAHDRVAERISGEPVVWTTAAPVDVARRLLYEIIYRENRMHRAFKVLEHYWERLKDNDEDQQRLAEAMWDVGNCPPVWPNALDAYARLFPDDVLVPPK